MVISYIEVSMGYIWEAEIVHKKINKSRCNEEKNKQMNRVIMKHTFVIMYVNTHILKTDAYLTLKLQVSLAVEYFLK